jgi:hypothetical protein
MSKARDLANAGTALTTVSATELGYLDGVTSAVQTQLDAKQGTVSGVDSTEIGYLDGVTSAIQTQINAQIPKSIVTAKGDILAATGSGTVVAQAIGVNGTVLTADSAEADGLKWAALPSSSPISASARVNTQQRLTSTSYGDLATSGPAVTITTGTKALVIVSAFMGDTGENGTVGYMSYAVSGATTIAASDDVCIASQIVNSSSLVRYRQSSVSRLSTLTAGSNTFTAKYKSGAAAGFGFSNREICVIDLGS